MRIAHLSAEVAPLARTGGLGEVVSALPRAQAALGHDVTVWMPLYRTARRWLERTGAQVSWDDPLRIELGPEAREVGIGRTTLPGSHAELWLIADDALFDREGLYDGFYGLDDGLVRYAVFVRAAMAAMRRSSQVPDILHAHDWHAALAPMALAWDAPRDWHFENTRTVVTLHNAAYQGVYDADEFVHLGLPRELLERGDIVHDDRLNLLKGALLAADAITAVSPTYARELATPEGGFGLDAVLRSRASATVGILNGIDTDAWNPSADTLLPFRYDASDLSGKALCRRRLLERAGMDPRDPGFVVGFVGRLVEQKGLGLLLPVIDDLLDEGIRFVIVGTGEAWLEKALRGIDRPGRFHAELKFDEPLSHLVEAGSDAFLMPSLFEPCGLNQLYSLAYGTPPIVRRVGGLADTVTGYDGTNSEGATGFVFDAPTPEVLSAAVRSASVLHRERPSDWQRMIGNGMREDHSWRVSAGAYLALYERLMQR